MAKKFLGDYKGIDDKETLPVFQLSITLVNMQSGKMSANTSTHFVEIGAVPSYKKLLRSANTYLRETVENVKKLSEGAEEVPHA